MAVSGLPRAPELWVWSALAVVASTVGARRTEYLQREAFMSTEVLQYVRRGMHTDAAAAAATGRTRLVHENTHFVIFDLILAQATQVALDEARACDAAVGVHQHAARRCARAATALIWSDLPDCDGFRTCVPRAPDPAGIVPPGRSVSFVDWVTDGGASDDRHLRCARHAQ